MTDQPLSLAVKPIITYPREVQVGKTYLMTIDLQPDENFEWRYEEEEYPIYCSVDSKSFSSKPVGEPVIVLHRFGGTYGEARFLMTTRAENLENVRVSLINSWGVLIKTLELEQIQIVAEEVQLMTVEESNKKLNSMYDKRDWLEVGLKFSVASRQEATTAEENVMRLLMQEIEDLLKETTRQRPGRIWTLHKIVGNQVIFYKSNNFQRSANHRRELVRSINDGLIGKAIRQDDDVVIFRDTSQEEGYIQEWDDCRAELIALVRESKDNPIGVINIESNTPNDFDCDDDFFNGGHSNFEERDFLIQKLTRIVAIASNCISLIFRSQSLIEYEKSSINLINAIVEARIVSKTALQEIVGNLAHWLNDRAKLFRVVLYLTEPDNANKYKILSHIDLSVSNTSNDIDRSRIPSELQHEEQMKALFGSGLRRFSKSNIATIFGDEFATSLLAGSNEPGIYFIASDVPGDQSIVAKYFVGLVLAEPVSNNFEVVQTFFDVAKNVVENYLNYSSHKEIVK